MLAVVVAIVMVTAFAVDTEEMADPKVDLNVKSTDRLEEAYNGIEPIEGRVWQIVRVNFTNDNTRMELEVSVPHFHAYTEEGKSYWVFNAEDYSYDPVPPGDNVTVELIFLIDEEDYIETLSYSRRSSGPVVCEMPQGDESLLSL